MLNNKVAHRPRSAWLAPVLTLALVLGLYSGISQGAETDGITLVHKDKLTLCTHLPYKPFEFSGDSGKTVGFDVDLAKLLADDLGVKVEVISMSWNQIISGAVFAAKKCDMGMGGASITEKRKKSVKFSDPYFSASQALIVKKGSGINNLSDMSGKRLGMQTATTGDIYAKKHAAKYHYEPVEYDDLALMLTAVSSGQVAGAIGDGAPLAYYAAHGGNTQVVDSFNTGEHYGFMVAKNDANADKLVKRFNADLAKARKDGSYDKIYKKWFGKAPSHDSNSSS